MHLPTNALPNDPLAQRVRDRRRVKRAVLASLAAAALLCAVYLLQGRFDAMPWTVGPHALSGLAGILTAPLLHGSPEHLIANVLALLALGTLAGTVYPRATMRTIPLAWLGSGIAAWLLGETGSHHLGASGVAQGLAYLVVSLALLRRDRASVAAAMIALTFSGGLLVAVLPHDPTVSWQSHLGGALAGILAAFLFRHSDPAPPRHRYSWEMEEDAATLSADDPSHPSSR
jgi:membrane associated rhomboid family serine protease